MALKPCRECKKQVSTEAATCPHCGVPQPVAPPSPSAASSSGGGAAKGCAVLLGAGVLLFVVVAISSSINDASERKNRQEAAERAAEQDSLRALAAISNPDTAGIQTLRAAEKWLKNGGRHDRPHPELHRAFISAQLSELTQLASGQRPNIPAATAIASTIDTFYSAAQRTTFRRDTARVNAARRRADREAQEAARVAAVNARRVYARKLEKTYLDQGLDVTVTTQGGQATTLRIKWILVSRVVAHQFSQNSEVFSTLRTLGFKRLEISDGYDEEWYWTIDS